MVISQRNCSLIVLLAILLLSNCFAIDKPNHLEPITPHYMFGSELETYAGTVFNSLVDNVRRMDLAMIAKPAFTSEYAVILRDLTPSDSSTGQYQLEYAIADPMIWGLLSQQSDSDTIEWRDKIVVKRQSATIPDSLCDLIYRAWETALLACRYAPKDWVGLDGETYEFFVWPREKTGLLSGQTWSPEKGVPKQMVELAELMKEYVTCAVPERTKVSERIAEKARAIIEQTDSQ